MSWTVVAQIGLALAAAATPRTAPQITHTEGAVHAGPAGVRTLDGRAEALFPDGSVVHVDRQTTVGFPDGGRVALRDGRLFVRTTATRQIDVELSIANVRLSPRGAYGILLDRAHGRLLVSVSVGHADITTPYGSTQVVAREMAMMTSATSRPYTTPFEPMQWDSFTQWSDARMTALAYGPQSPWTGAGVAQSGLVVDRPKDGSLTCSSWPAFDNPCWVIGAPSVAPLPPHSPTPYAPNYDPNYDPNFGTGPTPGPRPEPRTPGPGPRTPGRVPASPTRPPEVKPLPRVIEGPKPPTGPAAPPPAVATPQPAGSPVPRPPK